MSRVRLGINNCFAVKRWPEPECWTRLIREMGFEYVQFSFDLLDPYTEEARRGRIARKVARALKAEALELTSTFTGLAAYSWSMFGHPDVDQRDEAMTWWRRAIDLTAELGAPKTGGHFGAISYNTFGSPAKKREAVEIIIASVVQLSQYAKKQGLKAILWEAMATPREVPHSIAEVKELMTQVNRLSAVPIELCLDLGHACSYDLSVAERDIALWLHELLQFTTVIHLQQSDGQADRHWPFTPEFNKQGIIESKAIIDLIRSAATPDSVELDFEVIHAFEAPSEKVIKELIESARLWQALL